MSDVALPIFTIISILLIVLPAASHWRAKNVVILVLIMWLAVGNLNTFINRVIWMNRSSNVAPVWCDISVKLMSMVTMGIPCAMFCIAQKLEAIASMRDVSRDASKSTQKKLYEAAICCALPLAYSILTILSQGHRFNIIEGQGCSPAIYLSPVSIVIDYGMPLFMSVLSLIYSVLALKHFIMHKHEFESVLERSGNTHSTKKFLRMISFTLVDLLINFPILITGLSKELLYKDVEAYTSWELVHRNFSKVSEYPAYALNNPKGRKFLTVAELSAWMVCASGIVFFLLFGFSVDARIDYMKAKQRISSMFSRRLSAKRKSMDTVLPQREPIGEGKCSGEDSPYASIYAPSDRSFVVADNENSMSSSDSAKNS